MKSTKQSVSFSSSKSIYFLHGQGQRRFFEPISQQKVASLVIHRRVRKFCARTGKNSGKKKQPCGAQSTSLIHFIQDVSMFQRIPMLQRCLSTAHSWEKLSQGLQDESCPEHQRHFEVSFLSHPILGRPEERLQGNGLLLNFCMIMK